METYYTILGCKPTSTYEEIKRNYQKLIKTNHPDKGQESTSEIFIKINEAWQTLKDDQLRKKYDAILFEEDLNNRPLIYADIKVADLKFVDNLAYYTCRCGDNIVIDKVDIVGDENIFECSECTNCIVVRK